MQIRTANFSDLKDVKKLYRKAFPLIERKPFFMIWDKMQTGERCLPIRKHRGAREKRYSFGYAVFLILALMK